MHVGPRPRIGEIARLMRAPIDAKLAQQKQRAGVLPGSEIAGVGSLAIVVSTMSREISAERLLAVDGLLSGGVTVSVRVVRDPCEAKRQRDKTATASFM